MVLEEGNSGRVLRARLRFRYYHRNLLPQYFSNSLVYNWDTDTVVPDGLAPVSLRHANLTDGGLPGE